MADDRATYDFAGIGHRIRRAREELQLLRPKLDAFIEQQRDRIVHRQESNRQVWAVEGDDFFAPIECAIQIGEVLYNLRSALDHTVWQLVIANGQTPDRANAYPICRDEAVFNRIKRRTLRGVSAEAQAVISRYQPWRPPTHGLGLWLLHIMSNHDRHRHLLIAAGYSAGPIIREQIDAESGAMVTVSTVPMNEGEELLSIDDPKASFRPEFRLRAHFVDPAVDWESVRDEVLSGERRAEIAAIEKYGPIMRSVILALYSCIDSVDHITSALSPGLGSSAS